MSKSPSIHLANGLTSCFTILASPIPSAENITTCHLTSRPRIRQDPTKIHPSRRERESPGSLLGPEDSVNLPRLVGCRGGRGSVMAEGRRYAIAPQLEIEQILKEAQHRWLCPAEICEILKNHRNFRIAPEPPNRPRSGSLFLFDRKVLRYFRKDGHNWRKKRDGKTVKEAHERLKSGSIDVLHCYYAHGEENINFQRRSYWMLEEDFMHIVLVHYLEVKAGKSSSLSRVHDDMLQAGRVDTPSSQFPSQTTEGESSLSGQASEYDETESVYLKQNSVQQIFIRKEPDTTLSLGCSSMKMEVDL